MRLLFFTLLSFSGFSQTSNTVVLTPTTNIELDSAKSYIYCATMEIMWNELIHYLGGKPKPTTDNPSIQLLNKSISKNYRAPIEDAFVLAKSGFVQDSIIQKINAELQLKFKTTWNPGPLENDALVSFAYLSKDVKFYHTLDDDFYCEPFQGTRVMGVDYFGVKEWDPARSRKDLLVHDYKSPDDFIVHVKCLDSLDEIYFAKIPMQSTLSDTYQAVMDRVNLGNMELFNGGDVLKIPYIQFDTTSSYPAIEGAILRNKLVKNNAFNRVSQRINFDLNPQGIKLESSAMVEIVEFPDFENPPPRILAFDKPFLVIMKRKNSDLPYFMYWVSGAEFMRNYTLKRRVIDEHEMSLVGIWKLTNNILSNGDEHPYPDNEQVWAFKSDGTFEFNRQDLPARLGSWNYFENVISIDWLDAKSAFDTKWTLDELTPEKFIIGGKTKLVFKKD